MRSIHAKKNTGSKTTVFKGKIAQRELIISRSVSFNIQLRGKIAKEKRLEKRLILIRIIKSRSMQIQINVFKWKRS